MAPCEWLDVGPFLDRVSQSLELGELVHGDDFSLSQAMSAMVVGAPKMDSGMCAEKQRTAQELIADGAAPLDLSPEELVGVMDNLLALEASFHTGAGLNQSVYTCLYMHDLERLADSPYLHAFCEALRGTCCLVRKLVLTACVCEEEDFNVLFHGLPLETSEGDTKVKAILDSVETGLAQMLKKKSSKASMSPLLIRALLSRIRFRQEVYLGLEKLQRKTKQDLTQACRHFTGALMALETIRNTTKLGSPEPKGFDRRLDRMGSGGAPLRFVQVFSSDETWSHFDKFLDHLKLACSITSVTSYKELKAFLYTFAKKSPGAVERSALHLQLDARKGVQLPETQRWCPSLRMVGDAVNLPSTKGAMCLEVDYFLEQTLIGVQNWCQCMCLNRVRQRRRLRRGLDDWRNLMDHAYAADCSPTLEKYMKETGWQWSQPVVTPNSTGPLQGPLMTWIEQECCSSMVLHLLLGCELDVYQPTELLMVFWYCEYLFTKVLNSTRELFNARPAAMQPEAVPDSKGKKSVKKSKVKASAQADLVRTQRYAAELAFLEVERQLCQGFIRLFLGIKMLGVLKPPESPFNGEEERFFQRFSAFMELETPEPLDYEAFKMNTDPSDTPPENVLDGAVKCFKSSKDHSALIMNRSSISGLSEDKLAEVQALERVAKTNLVAASVLKSMAGSKEKLNVKFAFDVHSYFPVVSISR